MPANHKHRLIISAFLLTAVFGLISYLVSLDIFRDMDYKLMVNLQNYLDWYFDTPLSFFTLLGSTELSLIILAAVFIWVLYYKKHLFLSLFLFFIIYLIELSGKLLLFHPKPPQIFNRYAFDFHFPSSFIVNTLSSYPSGHMARSTFLSLIILYLILGKFKYGFRRICYSSLVVIFILLMFISRIFLGEHWFSDVIGGLILGSLAASLTLALW